MSKRRKNKRVEYNSKISKSRRTLLERVKKNFKNLISLNDDKLVRSEELGQANLSEVFAKFISPYKRLATTNEDFKKLVAIAATGWNAALLPPDEREKIFRNARKTLPDKQTKEDLNAIVDVFIKRKQKRFSEYTRMIVDFEVSDLGDEYHLSVVSMIKKTR